MGAGFVLVDDRKAASRWRAAADSTPVWVERSDVAGALAGCVRVWPKDSATIADHPFQAMRSRRPWNNRDAFASSAARAILDVVGRSPDAPWPRPLAPSQAPPEPLWRSLWSRAEWGVGLLDPQGRAHSLHRERSVTLADPFPFVHQGREWLFFEEQRPGNPGRIRAGVVEGGSLTEKVDPIDLGPTHRSWPNVFDHDGDVWMLPESGADGEVALWRCRSFPDRWQKERVLLTGASWTDPVLFEESGLWWLFVSAAGPSPHAHSDSLHLFHSVDPWRAPFAPHPWNPVSIGVVGSRPAGRLFREGNRLVRPAQDGSGRYGRALVFQSIDRLTPTEYRESPWRRMGPPPGHVGIHTWNHGDAGTYIDLLAPVRRGR